MLGPPDRLWQDKPVSGHIEIQTSGMRKLRRARDVFISYTKDDRGSAEWIAWPWQLEAKGYTTVLQAGSFARAKTSSYGCATRSRKPASVGDPSQRRRGTNLQKGRARRSSEESQL